MTQHSSIDSFLDTPKTWIPGRICWHIPLQYSDDTLYLTSRLRPFEDHYQFLISFSVKGNFQQTNNLSDALISSLPHVDIWPLDTPNTYSPFKEVNARPFWDKDFISLYTTLSHNGVNTILSSVAKLISHLKENPSILNDASQLTNLLTKREKPHDLPPFETIGTRRNSLSSQHPQQLPECEPVTSLTPEDAVQIKMDSLPEGLLLSVHFKHRVTKATYHQLAIEWCEYLLSRYEIHAVPYSDPLDNIDQAHTVQVVTKWNDNRHLAPRRGHRFGSLEQLLEKHIRLVQRLGISDQEVFHQVISLGHSKIDDSDDNRTLFRYSSRESTDPIALVKSSPNEPLPPHTNATDKKRHTSLFNIELTTSGFSEFRTGKVLSIILSIPYPDAVSLLRSAPCTILQSIPGDKAMHIKSLIERTGATIRLHRTPNLS